MIFAIGRGDFMGLINCPRHGTGFMFVCPHVSNAIVAGVSCPGIQRLAFTDANADLSGIELACWFCPACVQLFELPPGGAAIADGDGFLSRTGAIYRPMCPGCFDDWRTRGLG